MQLSTPFLICKTILQDTIAHPHFIKSFLKRYINGRSCSIPIGAIQTAYIFDYIPDADKRDVKLKNIFEIPTWPTESPLEKTHFTASASLADSYCLALFSQVFAKNIIIEIGTSLSESSLTFALNSPPDCTIHTLDIQRNNPSIGSKWLSTNESQKIKQHWSTLKDIEAQFQPKTADLIFIDGDHSYKAVLEDTEVALRLVRPGGLIIWHDYNFRFRSGVVKAIDELKSKYNLDIRKILHTNLAVVKIIS